MFGYERWSAVDGITRNYFPNDRARDRFMRENFEEKYNRIYTQVYINIYILRKNINVYTHKCTYDAFSDLGVVPVSNVCKNY